MDGRRGKGDSAGRCAGLQLPGPGEAQTRSLAARPPWLATHGNPSQEPNPEPADPRDQGPPPPLQGSGSWRKAHLCWEGSRRPSPPPVGWSPRAKGLEQEAGSLEAGV